MNPVVDVLKGLPQRREDVWQGGLVRLPAWVSETAGEPPWRPYAGLWISLRTRLLGLGDPSRLRGNRYGLALDVLAEFAESTAGYRPSAVEVSDPVLGERLGRVLTPAGIEVRLRDRLPAVEQVLDEMETRTSGPMRIPRALSVPGVTVERMRAFAEAAKEFYEAHPWSFLSSEDDIVRIESPTPVPELKVVSVMGMGGFAYGLAFYASTEHLGKMHEMEPREFFTKHSAWAVDFDSIDLLPFGDADLFEDHRLPVGGPKGYPLAKLVGPSLKIRRPDPTTLSFFEGTLRAFARTTETDADSGRWTKTVDTFDGSREFVLVLPDLLESAETPQKARGQIPDPRVTERAMEDIGRVLDQQDFRSPEEAQRFVDEKLQGKPVPHVPPRTPLERAQDVAYEAVEHWGRRRIQLARKAIEICPDCADAYVILAENAADVEEARRLYEEGVAAGERALGTKTFEEDAGHFWGITRTRPYMRARLGLAQTLEGAGELDGAIGHYRELLRLNPNDNQGVRDLLTALLLRLKRHEELQSLFERYPEEHRAEPLYARALHAFQRAGDSSEARQALDDALAMNSLVPPYLIGERDFPPDLPESYSLGSEDEAVWCAHMLLEAWESTPGALDWLKHRRDEKKTPQENRRRRDK